MWWLFYFTSIPVSRIGFILTGILSDYLRQNKRSKVPAPGQCQGAAWRQVGLAETLTAIEGPDKKYDNFKTPLEGALEHEQFVTASINTIYEEALKVKDFRTLEFLNWFVKEQGEEEKNAEELIQRYDLFGSDAKGLYMLDSEMGARVYAAPSLVLD